MSLKSCRAVRPSLCAHHVFIFICFYSDSINLKSGVDSGVQSSLFPSPWQTCSRASRGDPGASPQRQPSSRSGDRQEDALWSHSGRCVRRGSAAHARTHAGGLSVLADGPYPGPPLGRWARSTLILVAAVATVVSGEPTHVDHIRGVVVNDGVEVGLVGDIFGWRGAGKMETVGVGLLPAKNRPNWVEIAPGASIVPTVAPEGVGQNAPVRLCASARELCIRTRARKRAQEKPLCRGGVCRKKGRGPPPRPIFEGGVLDT